MTTAFAARAARLRRALPNMSPAAATVTRSATTRSWAPTRSSAISPNICSTIRSGRKLEVFMNEDLFNASLRKFLKKVGITSQREIEKAVRDAVASGRLKGHEKLPAKMVLTLGGVSLSHEIEDDIELG